MRRARSGSGARAHSELPSPAISGRCLLPRCGDGVPRQTPFIDELAYTNLPGSAREKRWPDVEAIRDAGIPWRRPVVHRLMEGLPAVQLHIVSARPH